MRKEKGEGGSGNTAEQDGASGSLWSCFSCPGTDFVLRILPMSSCVSGMSFKQHCPEIQCEPHKNFIFSCRHVLPYCVFFFLKILLERESECDLYVQST